MFKLKLKIWSEDRQNNDCRQNSDLKKKRNIFEVAQTALQTVWVYGYTLDNVLS